MKPDKAELIKANSRGLRGSIAEELAEPTAIFSSENGPLLKFHGVYEQDDRDLRRQLKKEGKDKAYSFMVRTKVPAGGRLTPEQWEVMDRLATDYGNGTLRVTTRQCIQLHGVGKGNLKKVMAGLNAELITTYGACGDGTRNVMGCPVSAIRKGSNFDATEWAEKISNHLAFRSNAYCEIWLDGEKLENEDPEPDPIYGKTYLPRKFKIGVAAPDDNCIDVYTHDVGLIPSLRDGELAGFTVLVGGGMGSTHGKTETYPRLGEPLTFAAPEELLEILESVVAVQRDFGNRGNRKRARMKYLVDVWGIEKFRSEVGRELGRSLNTPEAEGRFEMVEHHLGWHEQNTPGLWYVGVFIENGRIKDGEGGQLKTGLLEIIREFRPTVRLTPTQDVLLTDLPEGKVDAVKERMRKFGLKTEREVSSLRSLAIACPALPTCGLALTEAERYLPSLIGDLEDRGYGEEAVGIRMSGCPNACSRPPVAEIGLMGKGKDKYNVYVGGSPRGDRIARLQAESVHADDLADHLSSMLNLYRAQREPSESFGDFAHRVGTEALQSNGGR